MNAVIRIENIVEIVEGEYRLLKTVIDGEEVWIKLPVEFQMNTSAELFLSVVLLEAMISHRNIEISDDISVSPTLLKNLEKLQRIYHLWNHLLQPIEIHATYLKEPKPQTGSASFFSGGVDSSYTLCSNFEVISHLIVLSGFDTLEKPEQWAKLVHNHQAIASALDKKLICIESNITEFNDRRKISRMFQHGLTLAGVGIALGFSQVYIPSSSTYSYLFPLGSHPCTDPLWSTAITSVVHDGAERTRSEKTFELSKFPVLLDNLQVCWNNISYNCGKCSKCLRTMIACHLYGIKCNSLPDQDIFETTQQLKIGSASGEPFFDDLISLAKEKGQFEIERILGRTHRNFLIKLHFEAFVNLLTNGKLKKLVRKQRKTQWTEFRVTMSPNTDK